MSAAQDSASVLGMLSGRDPSGPDHHVIWSQAYVRRYLGGWKRESPVSEKNIEMKIGH